ncbi:MAG: hypothetical protein RLZZ292_2438 [Bacteroidota bacterium]|jgi:hypothetical protein
MKNYLIVESINDKFFLEACLAHLKLNNTEVSNATICGIDDYESMGGLDPEKLRLAISHLKDKSDKSSEPFNIGIVIDWDGQALSERLALVNTAIQKVFKNNNNLTAINQFITVAEDVKMACYFNGVNGKGELETVLKEIKSEPSNSANCLNTWRDCIKPQNISQKEFDKFWITVYTRYDTCSKKEKNQAQKNCSFEAAMKKPIWKFDHPCLQELQAFLTLFS